MDQYLQGQSAAFTSAQAPVAKPDVHLAATGEFRARPVDKAGVAEAATPMPAGPSLRAALRAVLAVANSWIGIASLLLLSELSAFVSHRAVGDSDRFLFLSLTSLPLGAAGLISICRRLYEHLRLLGKNTVVGLGMAAIGVLLVAIVPAFFQVTHPPAQYAAAAAWPFVLLGGLGLGLIGAVLMAEGGGRNVKGWAGAAIALLVLAWLDSSPTSRYLPMLDWRVRSVVIFTCVLVGSTIIVVIASRVVLRFTRHGFANNVAGE